MCRIYTGYWDHSHCRLITGSLMAVHIVSYAYKYNHLNQDSFLFTFQVGMGYEMSKWVVLIFTILNIIKEIFQMVQQVGHAVIHDMGCHTIT